MNKLMSASLWTDKDSEYYETKGGLIDDFIDIHEVHLTQIASDNDLSLSTFIITMPESGKIKIATRDSEYGEKHRILKITPISDQEFLVERIER